MWSKRTVESTKKLTRNRRKMKRRYIRATTILVLFSYFRGKLLPLVPPRCACWFTLLVWFPCNIRWRSLCQCFCYCVRRLLGNVCIFYSTHRDGSLFLICVKLLPIFLWGLDDLQLASATGSNNACCVGHTRIWLSFQVQVGNFFLNMLQPFFICLPCSFFAP